VFVFRPLGLPAAAHELILALRRTQVLFPPFPFQHAVETEGLAKVAIAMGYQAWGMPLVEVEHK
jgi:hypothetical protein